jgi:hypothetical protein
MVSPSIGNEREDLMRYLEDDFGIPVEHIADATQSVRHQRALLQQLAEEGQPTAQAEATLKAMLLTLGAVRERQAYVAAGGRLH